MAQPTLNLPTAHRPYSYKTILVEPVHAGCHSARRPLKLRARAGGAIAQPG